MKMAGHPSVRLIWYPGEGHGNRKRLGRADYVHRTLAWFDHYLMDRQRLGRADARFGHQRGDGAAEGGLDAVWFSDKAGPPGVPPLFPRVFSPITEAENPPRTPGGGSRTRHDR